MSVMKTIFQTLKAILKILQLFIAALAPLMFLVGVIAALDRAGAQRRLLEKLETYGKVTDATVSYIDDEYNRAGVDYLRSNGQTGYGTLDFRYYPAEVWQTLQSGDTVQILYIDALISESEKTILVEYYDAVQAYPLVEPDVWGILLFSWLFIVVTPQFVFLGMVEFDDLLKTTLPEKL